jgi:hypothetical protein
MQAGVIPECRRRRFHETPQDIVKRKQQNARRKKLRYLCFWHSRSSSLLTFTEPLRSSEILVLNSVEFRTCLLDLETVFVWAFTDSSIVREDNVNCRSFFLGGSLIAFASQSTSNFASFCTSDTVLVCLNYLNQNKKVSS